MTDLTLRDPAGRSVEIQPGRAWLIAYLAGDPASAASRAVYLGILASHFPTKKLGVLSVLGPAQSALVEQLEERDLGYPILTDIHGALAVRLGMEEPTDRLWILGSDGLIEFVGSGWMLQDGDLRQLTEKQVNGEVTYFDRSLARALKTGQDFPSLTVDDVVSGERFRLDPGSKTPGSSFDRLVVFSADCVNCSLSGSLSRLERQIEDLRQGGRKVAAVFSSRFSAAEIASEASYRHLQIPLLVALDEISGIEDRYYLQSLHSQVTIVDLDPQGRVEGILSFNTIDEQRDGPDSHEPAA